MSLTVSKFGGTSMADADSIRRSAKIATRNNASIIVVSAVSGITDKLIYLAEYSGSLSKKERLDLIAEIDTTHRDIARDLGCEEELDRNIENYMHNLDSLVKAASILGRPDPRLSDAIISNGELLSSRLIHFELKKHTLRNVEWVDARSIIKTDNTFGRALPLPEKIKQKAIEKLVPNLDKHIYVTQGFIGKTDDNRTTTLGRGGSDYSAALFAEAIEADGIQIWTDVAGVASIDPRLSDSATAITNLSFQEAAEMATSGAKILHPPTMIPARRASIPIFVGSTFEPDAIGTKIMSKPKTSPLVRAITIKKDQRLVTLSTPRMSEEYGFLARIFNVFADHKISIDLVTTSEVSVSITMDETLLKNDGLFQDLKKIADIDIEDDLSIVALIGNRVNHTAGLLRRASSVLQPDGNELNIRAVFQGASRHCVAFILSNEEAAEAARKLHKEFILNSRKEKEAN